MKILVTGCNGYIGSHTAKELSQCGYELYGLDCHIRHNISSYIDLVWSFNITDNVQCLDAVTKVFWDVVIHLAALVSVQESVQIPTQYYATNWQGTVNLIKNIKFKKFIFSSTSAAFSPQSPYGLSKLIAEQSIRELCPNYTIFRFYNVVGENGFSITNNDGLLAKLREASKTGKFSLYGNDYDTKDGTCIRDYVHVSDIAQSIVKAVELPAFNTPFECLGYGQSITVLEFVKAYQRVNNVSFDIITGDRRAGDQGVSQVSFVSKCMQKNYSLDDIVKDTSSLSLQ